MANVVCMLLKMKEAAEEKELQWYKELTQVGCECDELKEEIEQLVTEKCVLKERCMLREQCIAYLDRREAENERIISLLRKQLQEAQTTIVELSTNQAKAEHSQCSTQIEALEQLGKPNALVDACDVASVGISVGKVEDECLNKNAVAVLEIDSGVEMDSVSDLSSVSDSSDSGSIRSFGSNHTNIMQQCESPCARRRAYAGRPALKCFACKKWGHIARYCWASNNNNNNNRQRKSQYPKTTPRRYEVYSARWGSNPSHGGHSYRTRVPHETQMLRLQAENSHVRQERYLYRYSTGENKSLVSSP